MQYNLGLVARGLQQLHHFLEQKDFFLHNIGVDERKGIDKKTTKKLHRKEGMQPKSDIPHADSSMYFFL